MSEDARPVLDELTGDVTLVSRERARRPNEFLEGMPVQCAFCPGNERETPPEVAAYHNRDGEWLVRAFTNKYPTVRPPQGAHEVIVDSRDHLGEITALGVKMWHERYVAALDRMPDATPIVFKNSGAYAGATIVHPHTQLLALQSEIPRWDDMQVRAAAYRARHQRCVWCDEIARARSEGTLVWEDGAFAAYTRAESRFESALTIAPHECEASWRALAPKDAQALGVHLVRVADALHERHAAFNLAVVAMPRAGRGEFHWHVEVIPRTFALAGLELSAGMFVRSGSAQESAEQWRRTLAVLNGPV